MDIITKIKEILFELFSKKIFRLAVGLLLFVFVIRNYTSISDNITKFKNDHNINSLSVSTIKNSIDNEILKENQKRQEVIKRKKTQNIKYPEITPNTKVFVVEAIIFNETENNVVFKMDEMSLLVDENHKNFAKHLQNKKVGDVVIVPIKDIIEEKDIPDTKTFYKMTIKEIKNLP